MRSILSLVTTGNTLDYIVEGAKLLVLVWGVLLWVFLFDVMQ